MTGLSEDRNILSTGYVGNMWPSCWPGRYIFLIYE